MSIINLLLLFVIWMAWSPQQGGRAWPSPIAGILIFFSGYFILIFAVALWSRRLARGISNERIMDGMRRYNWVVSLAQMAIPAWLGVGAFFLGWGDRVQLLLGPIARSGAVAPGVLVGILPGLLAWMGLWFAQYPVDHALREQNLLSRLDRDMPVYAPPSFWIYFLGKLRMQMLLIIVPILLIATMRDIAGVILQWLGIGGNTDMIDSVRWGGSMLWVFIMGPEVMRRVLATETLPDPELRRRLEVITQRAGVRARVLLWRTHHTVGNALVMGPVAWFRYVLLSDLLLECLTDDEVSAVFAHEIGHIRHRHIIWYAVFLFGLGLALFGANDLADRFVIRIGYDPATIDQFFPIFEMIMFVLSFGFLSRRFERQADVYAARTLEAMKHSTGIGNPTHVGPEGARIFNAALLRVAEVNNVPLQTYSRFAGSFRQRIRFLSEWFGNLGGSWLHGTMASRMSYIEQISLDPKLTAVFDSRMRRVKTVLVILLIAFGGWAVWISRLESTDIRSLPQPVPAAVAPTAAIDFAHLPPAAG